MAVTLPEWPLPLAGRGETVTVGGVPVENVLVSPGDAQDSELSEEALPAGAVIRYRLDFPKAFGGELEGAEVVVRGEELRIVGHPVRYSAALTPGDWDMPAFAMKAVGDWSATVQVVELIATLDALGDPVASERVVYEGPAQARNPVGSASGGSEAPGTVEEQRAKERWRFVVPWQDAFASLRPTAALVRYNGAEYDVSRIVNVDERSETASIEAVRHG